MSTQPVFHLDDLREAQRVLRLEAEALSLLADRIGQDFLSAVDRLVQLEGRVVTTGMGKSGHIAHKIAATFASTGTPAFFVHPGEASHGDLGMILKQDVVLALSNSGETSELSDVLAYTRRHHIFLIGITTKEQSTLAKLADIALVLPNIEEACPLGLAPTTSTTMMMALGDALATTVLKRRSFSVSDFRSLHPGGRLGQRLMKVSQLMRKDEFLPLVTPGTLMSEAILIMTSKGLGCVGVVDAAQNLVGMITDGDLRRHLSDDLLKQRVEDVMTLEPRMINGDVLAQEAIARMNEFSITGFFVTAAEDSRKPIGFLHVHDCLRAGLG